MKKKQQVPRSSSAILLFELYRNCYIGKHRHFLAANRARMYGNFIGTPVILINVALGSVLFVSTTAKLPEFTNWIGGLLALVAALGAALQTYYNFDRVFEGHRKVGNDYLEIERECQLVYCSYQDGLMTLQRLTERLEDLQKRYNDINRQAEHLPTSNSDYKKALHFDQGRTDWRSKHLEEVAQNHNGQKS
ncbi:hypothetical protein CH373_14625 [Leptospira perolatii]|uniref:SMODS and SLOG-associating 2TM effector domain-containing protein n=1 Tax=Leptospira perolatii TaxID=2023191 RepID=A0A2M9ZKC3_9LEPT|nr:SLATT domain-containing protein [Leptospira perolatii]PJZ69235.1 hypothetical protein CH360_11995 [Leptospira perolatii]PJZ72383.1 hypothetical protein CH373_14625 [Leptospira perolatii]